VIERLAPYGQVISDLARVLWRHYRGLLTCTLVPVLASEWRWSESQGLVKDVEALEN
jgi:hypothetical protein